MRLSLKGLRLLGGCHQENAVWLCALVIGSLVLSGCGGGISGGVVSGIGIPVANAAPVNQPSGVLSSSLAAPSSASVPVHLSFVLPKSTRKAQYISSSNANITIAVTPLGGSTSTFGPGACTIITCTLSFSGTPGLNTIVFTLTDNSSNLLSSLTTTTFLQSSIVNVLKFTANPVVNSVILQLASPSVNAGTPINDALIVNAKDRDGNTIIGKLNYVDVNGDPVTFSLNVTNAQDGGRGTVSIVGPSLITAPEQAVIYAHYDGNWLNSSTISVSSTNSSVASLTGATLTTTPSIIEYPLALTGSAIWGITRGNNNDLWAFENSGAGYVAEISMNGTLLREYQTPTANSVPNEGVIGSDGNLWITENNSGRVERLTTDGTRNDFQVSGATTLNYITTGPGGNLWITDSGKLELVRMSTNGLYSIIPLSAQPGGITLGPDGNLWVTLGNAISRVSTQGNVLNTYSFGSSLVYILTGPDGNIWFDDNSTGKVQCISINGSLLHTIALGGTTAPYDMAVGPDNNIWVTESGTNKIARISTSGALLSTVNLPSSGTPIGITTGPDGNLWITEDGLNNVAKLVL